MFAIEKRRLAELGRFGLWLTLGCLLGSTPARAAPVGAVIDQVQPKIVKIYGAGGFRGMEPYQSGMLISPDGLVLTVWSYVLDTEEITATLHDGRKFTASLVGADPRMEVALLRIEAENLPHFSLDEPVEAEVGTRVLAFSNLFGVATGNEPVSVQQGVVSVKTQLEARRGAFETPYDGPVYVIDAVTNNPGAAGGALVTRRGELIGMLGKELRNALNNTWLNYAVPVEQLRPSIERIVSEGGIGPGPDEEGPPRPARALELAKLGIVLVPDVLHRTPPYVDFVREGSPADKAGVQPDDLVLLLNDRLIQSCKALVADLEYIDHQDEVKLTVLREQELIDFDLRAAPNPEPAQP